MNLTDSTGQYVSGVGVSCDKLTSLLNIFEEVVRAENDSVVGKDWHSVYQIIDQIKWLSFIGWRWHQIKIELSLFNGIDQPVWSNKWFPLSIAQRGRHICGQRWGREDICSLCSHPFHPINYDLCFLYNIATLEKKVQKQYKVMLNLHTWGNSDWTIGVFIWSNIGSQWYPIKLAHSMLWITILCCVSSVNLISIEVEEKCRNLHCEEWKKGPNDCLFLQFFALPLSNWEQVFWTGGPPFFVWNLQLLGRGRNA